MSRVIAGSAKGRALAVPGGLAIRPTPAKVREALFSIVAPVLPGARVLDLWAGVGTLGIEALSRGAAHCTFVDSGRQALRFVRQNLEHTGLSGQAVTLQRRLPEQVGTVTGGPFDLVLSDPPYADDPLVQLAWRLLAAPDLIAPGALWVHELPGKRAVAEPPALAGWELLSVRRYGDTGLLVLKALTEAQS
jgi:16S rRNA (guanine966-N2)-methyltransferase